MTLARDMSAFADQVNTELDGIVNGMAEQAGEVEKVKAESSEFLQTVFERLGAISSKLECLGRIERAVESFDLRLTSIQDGHHHDMKDIRVRVGLVEAKVMNATHPSEEVTPRPGPSLSGRKDPRSG